MHIEEHTHYREIYKPPVKFNCTQRNLHITTESKINCIKMGDNAYMFINSKVLSGIFCAALKICIRTRNAWLLTKKDDGML